MRKLLGIVLISMLLGGGVLAKEHRFELGEVRVWFPETWASEDHSDGTAIFTDPEEKASVVLLAIDPLQDATLEEDLTELMKQFLDKPQQKEPWLERQVNDIRTVESGGEGHLDGHPVQYKVGYFEISDDCAVFFLSAVEKGSSEEHFDTMMRITNSIKRL